MDVPSVKADEGWLVIIGCRKCADRGITPPQLAQVVRRSAVKWDVHVRVARIGLPRPGNERDVQGYVRRYSQMHPERTRQEVADGAVRMLKPYAEKLRLDRGQFAPAPIRGRFIIDCDRGHRVQTTAASLIRLGGAAITGGSAVVETRGCGMVSLRVQPLRPLPPSGSTPDGFDIETM